MTDRPRAAPPADITLEALRKAFAEWRIWPSDSGRLWATWPHPLSSDELKADWQRTLDANDEVRMWEVLEEEMAKRADLP